MHALLAIKPEFAEKILDGEKHYEFRRKSFQDAEQLELIFLYASSPVKRIVGLFTSDRVVEASPDELWNLFSNKSGIAKRDRFMNYFEGVDTGYAIHVDRTHRFNEPIDPTELFGDYSPPMSFNYLDDNQEAELMPYVPEDFREETMATDLTRFSSK